MYGKKKIYIVRIIRNKLGLVSVERKNMGFGEFVGGILSDITGGLIGGSMARHEADTQRRWASDMSSTAYQRAAKDLEKAGLNRILAVGSPASTPSGGIATTPDFSQIGSRNLATAIEARKAKSTIKLQDTNASNAKQQARSIKLQNKLDEQLVKYLEKNPEMKEAYLQGRVAKEAGEKGRYGVLLDATISRLREAQERARNTGRSVRNYYFNIKKKFKEGRQRATHPMDLEEFLHPMHKMPSER